MASTKDQAIPYAGPNDAPDVPYWMQRMAERVDALLTTLFLVPPAGHMGKTGGFQAGSGNLTGVTQVMAQAQLLKGGVTYDNTNNALVIPKDGTYRITVQGMTSGATSATNITKAQVRRGTANPVDIGAPATGPKPDNQDVRYSATSMVPLLAGDKISLLQASNASSWGTTGYDGSYVEVDWVTG